MSTNEIFNQMLSGYDFSLYMNFFLQNNITIVTTQDSYLIISHLWVTIRAFSIVT